MEKLIVDLSERSYPIYITTKELSKIGSVVKQTDSYQKILIVSDENVAPTYLASVEASLQSNNIDTYSFIIPPGEQSKSLSMAEKLYTEALQHHLDRRSAILALGGGVVGDLTGFIASTYMRGIDFIQVPTTLLAQVDSSVGGKVAVNHPLAKNIIGSFYQPRIVFIDVDTLNSLPSRQLSSGLAEVIKYGVILDKDFFGWLEKNMEKALLHHTETLLHIVQTSCKIKARIVKEDERDNNIRALLNFGHTIGHAVEAVTHYNEYTHGEGVAIGMAYAVKLAISMNLIPPEILDRVINLLRSAHLPYVLDEKDIDSLIRIMLHDKKNINEKLLFILPNGIGSAQIYEDIGIQLVKQILSSPLA